LEQVATIVGGHQREIVAMKEVITAQTKMVNVQSALIMGLLSQVRNLQEVVDPVGRFVNHPIMVEDDSDEEVWEEDRSVVIQEATWTGGRSIPSVHTLYTMNS
jgi:hypothetical protein